MGRKPYKEELTLAEKFVESGTSYSKSSAYDSLSILENLSKDIFDWNANPSIPDKYSWLRQKSPKFDVKSTILVELSRIKDKDTQIALADYICEHRLTTAEVKALVREYNPNSRKLQDRLNRRDFIIEKFVNFLDKELAYFPLEEKIEAIEVFLKVAKEDIEERM